MGINNQDPILMVEWDSSIGGYICESANLGRGNRNGREEVKQYRGMVVRIGLLASEGEVHEYG